MSSTPWYAWYPADYKGKTSRLTYAQDCAYRRLLDEYYLMAEALPVAMPELWRICNAQTEEERAAVEYVCRRFFSENSGQLHNKRADRELARLAALRKSLSERGRAGAQARWDSQSNATGNAIGNGRTIAGSMAYPQPQLEPQKHVLGSSRSSISPKEKDKGKRGTGEKPILTLPDWIPQEHWDAWIEARTKRRNPPTDYAKRLAISKLANLREQGYPPVQVLMQSAFNGWSGLFPTIPPKEAK